MPASTAHPIAVDAGALKRGSAAARHDQHELAIDFAGGLPGSERFGRHGWRRLPSGNPALLAGSCAGFDYAIVEHLHVGSYLVVIAGVENCGSDATSPLLYSDGRHGGFS
ncbi:MAG: flavin reductase [Pseudomonas sp.]